MKTTKVYDVEFGLDDSDGDRGNWSRKRVLAKTATEAITTANKTAQRGLYVRAVKEVCDTEQ